MGLSYSCILDKGCSSKKNMGVFDGTFILPPPHHPWDLMKKKDNKQCLSDTPPLPPAVNKEN